MFWIQTSNGHGSSGKIQDLMQVVAVVRSQSRFQDFARGRVGPHEAAIPFGVTHARRSPHPGATISGFRRHMPHTPHQRGARCGDTRVHLLAADAEHRDADVGIGAERFVGVNSIRIAPARAVRSVVRRATLVIPWNGMLHKREMTIRRVAFGSVVRLVAAGMLGSVVPFFGLMGVLGGFEYSTLTWNGAQVFGWKAVLMHPFTGLFAAALFTLFAGLSLGFGLWLYSLFKPIRLTVLEDDAGSGVPDPSADPGGSARGVHGPS